MSRPVQFTDADKRRMLAAEREVWQALHLLLTDDATWERYMGDSRTLQREPCDEGIVMVPTSKYARMTDEQRELKKKKRREYFVFARINICEKTGIAMKN